MALPLLDYQKLGFDRLNTCMSYFICVPLRILFSEISVLVARLDLTPIACFPRHKCLISMSQETLVVNIPLMT